MIDADALSTNGIPFVLYADPRLEITRELRERYLKLEGEVSDRAEE